MSSLQISSADLVMSKFEIWIFILIISENSLWKMEKNAKRRTNRFPSNIQHSNFFLTKSADFEDVNLTNQNERFHLSFSLFFLFHQKLNSLQLNYIHMLSWLKVRKSRKQIMVSSILPRKEIWDNFSVHKIIPKLLFRLSDL